MDQIIENQAAWIPYERAPVLQVGPGPKPNPAENEVVIRVAYAAVNPTDWKMQDTPYFQLKYPFIFGTDVSGTITQLGSGVNRFKIGQRVIGHCDSLLSNKASNAGFQLYTTCREILVSALPDSLPLDKAAVLPLSISTAAGGLYKILQLPLPLLNPTPTGKRILIWGGSSSCGSTAIQLAVASGLSVVATAGADNQKYVKDLGASHAFDYKDPSTVDAVLKILKKGDFVFDCIGAESCQKACAEIVSKLGGEKFACVNWPMPTHYDGVNGVLVNGLDVGLVDFHLGDAVWRKYIPEALAANKFQAKPDGFVIKGGLQKVQDGIDLLRKGVSAKKIIIEVTKPE